MLALQCKLFDLFLKLFEELGVHESFLITNQITL